jgi:SAM-dependent methyltransferase
VIEPIPFDPRRFRSAAAHYLAGRPSYAAALPGLVARVCGLEGAGRALDLGCGPGQLARAFSPYVAGVLAVDPEPEMLAVGEGLTADPTIEYRLGSSQDISSEMGLFRLVTIGRAFHWMDRVETVRRLDYLVDPGGAIALFRVDHLDVPENGWRVRYQSVLDMSLGGGGRVVWKQPNWVKHEAVLLESSFCALVRIGVIERVRTPVASLLDRALSMSTTTRDRLGSHGVNRLREAITAVLVEVAEEDLVTEVLESTALIARRP